MLKIIIYDIRQMSKNDVYNIVTLQNTKQMQNVLQT
jgi:hypothetical protein